MFRLPAYLAEPRAPARAILLGWPTTTIPALALAALSAKFFPNVAPPPFEGSNGLVFFLVVAFSPIVETLIMAVCLEGLLRVLPKAWAVVASAVGWGIAHSLAAPTWGLVIWWPFLIFSLLYVTWRARSIPAALAIVAAVHALNNLGPALALLR